MNHSKAEAINLLQQENPQSWNKNRSIFPRTPEGLIDLTDIELEELSLEGIDLSEVDLSRSRFKSVNFTASSFYKSSLVRCSFYDCNLSFCDFSYSSCYASIFIENQQNEEASFYKASLKYSIFERCDWTSVVFIRTNFARANIKNTKFIGCSFRGCNMNYTKIESTEFEVCHSLSKIKNKPKSIDSERERSSILDVVKEAKIRKYKA